MIRFKKIYNRGYVILLFNYAVNFNIFNELVKSILLNLTLVETLDSN